MAELVDVLVEDERWDGIGLPTLAQAACVAALKGLKLDPDRFEISLLGCSDAKISVLNADFRGKPAPTNVLSWPSEERAADAPGKTPSPPRQSRDANRTELGDIAIAYETCEQEALAARNDLAQHVTHLLVHATLHLLGYDHMSQEDARLMEQLEREILATMGHPDPYE